MRDLPATTEAGADLVERAERFASRFADAAAHHDRTRTYAHDHVAALRDDGFLYAPLPPELGGLGVSSAHDVLVAASRLARGDAATAIGVNMHLAVLGTAIRAWRIAQRLGQSRRAEAQAARLGALAWSGTVLATAVSERDQDLRRPATRATQTADGEGWVIDGSKWFCTMVPAATLLSVAVTFVDEDGRERYGFALVPPGAPGVEIHDDWDALGMRASGSNSVTFRGVRVGRDAVRDGFPVDRPAPELLDRYLASGVFHAAASLGIAEAAYECAATALRKGAASNADDAFTRVRLAEAAVALGSIRAVFDRAAHLVDEVDRLDPTGRASVEDWAAWFAEAQAAKTAVNEGAVRVVDLALALSGGAGYRSEHPLARAYRDVRAGSFMHPLGANRAARFIADVELGEVPDLR